MHAALLALPFGLAIGLSLDLGGGGSILAVPVLVVGIAVFLATKNVAAFV